LHEILKPHAVLPSPTKETRFFDVHFHRGLDWYLAHFRASRKGQIMGEVAPTYFASAHAQQRISRLAPSAKAICIFRNPVERVWSLYRLKRAYGMLPWNFERAIAKDSELIETGRYATHLKAWQNALGKDRVLPMVYEDLCRDPQAFLNTVTDFIELPRITLADPDLRQMHDSENLTHPYSYFLTRFAWVIAEWFKAGRFDGVVAAAKKKVLLKLLLRSGSKFESLSPDRAIKLYEVFRPEIEELELLLQRDFTGWKTHKKHAPGLTAKACSTV
jgi:hypothetical protein